MISQMCFAFAVHLKLIYEKAKSYGNIYNYQIEFRRTAFVFDYTGSRRILAVLTVSLGVGKLEASL